jgi:dihydroorotase
MPRFLPGACLALGVFSTPVAAQPTAMLDVIVVGGRVIDPETRLDAVRHVGIRGGTIVYIGAAMRSARDTIDAKGQVVSPGFIDLHQHGQQDFAYDYAARDGVTTALEMELGSYPVAPWYAERAGKARVNFGITVSHPGARRAMLDRDSSRAGSLVIGSDGKWARERIDPNRFPELGARIDQGLREGALGVGMGLAYTVAASRAEAMDVFRHAAKAKVPVYVHARSGGPNDADGPASVQEVIADATATGAPLHVVHITSIGAASTPFALDLVDGARRRGLDVTTEAYPYNAGATYITAAIFDEGFQQRLGVDYKDLMRPETGERLNAETFAKYRKIGSRVILFMIPDSVPAQTYRRPGVIVASDGGFSMVDGKIVGHPRSAGTFARVLGEFVRTQRVLSLPDAIARMTLLPAKRVEGADPRMKKKGRVQVGADADITVFDPARVIDKATFENAAQYSEGITHVLVNGVAVVRNGELVPGVAPGRAVRGRTGER